MRICPTILIKIGNEVGTIVKNREERVINILED